MPRAFSGNLCLRGVWFLSVSLVRDAFHHTLANLSGMTSHGHTAIGVSCLAAKRTPPRRLRRPPPLGSRGSANSRTVFPLGACVPSCLSRLPSQVPGLDGVFGRDGAVHAAGPSSRVQPPPASPAPASRARARSCHLWSAASPPSRSTMFRRIASPAAVGWPSLPSPSISRLRLTLRFHRSSARMRRCNTAIRAASAERSLKTGSRLSSPTTRSTASSSAPMRAHRAPTFRSPSCDGAFQSAFMPPN